MLQVQTPSLMAATKLAFSYAMEQSYEQSLMNVYGAWVETSYGNSQ